MTLIATAVAYERFSTDNQSSTEEQEGVNRDLAEDLGLVIERHFHDEGITRSLSDREGLMRMFDYVEANPHIKYIIVNELERLTAGVGQRAAVTRMCKRLGITIVTEDIGVIDPRDEDKMHEADQRAVASAGEVLKIRRRTRRSLKQKARRGVVILRPPYGTVMTPDGLEVDDEEIEWVRRMFEWAGSGVAIGQIRRKLDEEGVLTKSGLDRWSTTAIRGILDNPFYKGQMTWGARRTLRDEDGKKYRERRAEDDPEVIVNPSPLGELIPVELWDKVAALKVTNSATRVRSANQVRVLDNYVFCARCGYKMYCRDNGRRAAGVTQLQYVCYTNTRPARKPLPEFDNYLCSEPHSVSLKYLLAAIAGGKATGGLSIAPSVTIGGGGDIERHRKRLAAEIVTARTQRENAQRLAIKGKISDSLLDEAVATADRDIAQAERKLLALEDEGGIVMAPFAGIYDVRLQELALRLSDETRPVALRRELVSGSGLDRIYVDKPVLRLHFRD